MKRIIFVFLAVISIFLISGCCEVEMKEFDYTAFKQEWDAWEATKPESYEYIYHANSVNEDYLVRYSNGEYKITETYYNRDCSDDTYMTIEGIYQSVENTYKEYNHKILDVCEYQVVDIIIKYDKTNHIPTYVYDRLYDENVSGNFPITITDFKITE